MDDDVMDELNWYAPDFLFDDPSKKKKSSSKKRELSPPRDFSPKRDRSPKRSHKSKKERSPQLKRRVVAMAPSLPSPAKHPPLQEVKMRAFQYLPGKSYVDKRLPPSTRPDRKLVSHHRRTPRDPPRMLQVVNIGPDTIQRIPITSISYVPKDDLSRKIDKVERFEKPEIFGRSEDLKHVKSEKQERLEKPEIFWKSEDPRRIKKDKQERLEKPEIFWKSEDPKQIKLEKQERFEKPEIFWKSEDPRRIKSDKQERFEKPEIFWKSEDPKQIKSEKQERFEKPGIFWKSEDAKQIKSEKQERFEKPEVFGKSENIKYVKDTRDYLPPAPIATVMKPEKDSPVGSPASWGREGSPEPTLSAWAKEQGREEDAADNEAVRSLLRSRLAALADRDKSVRLRPRHSGPLKGTCPDMCPERERLMRQLKALAHPYECRGGVLAAELAVKEYARSSADQEQPLPHDLRPQPVLSLTMAYLVTQIIPRIDDGSLDSLQDWYDFLWDRLRAIRKDIVQQQLCDLETVKIVEQCARFHIACFDRLSTLGAAAFDVKINAENLMHCLKMLLGMYEDLRRAGTKCENEPEFTAYMILLRLASGDLLWEFPNFPLDLQQTPPVIEAVHTHTIFNTNAYAHFFRQVARTSYLNAILMQRFFFQVRVNALFTMACAYPSPGKVVRIAASHVARSLRFDSDEEAAAFCALCGVTASERGGDLKLSRTRFSRPEGPPPATRPSSLIEVKRFPLAHVVVGPNNPLPVYLDHEVHCSFVEGSTCEIKKSSMDASDQEEKMLRDNMERRMKLKALNAKIPEIVPEIVPTPPSPKIDVPDSGRVVQKHSSTPTPPPTPLPILFPFSDSSVKSVSPPKAAPKFDYSPVKFNLDFASIQKALGDIPEEDSDKEDENLDSEDSGDHEESGDDNKEFEVEPLETEVVEELDDDDDDESPNEEEEEEINVESQPMYMEDDQSVELSDKAESIGEACEDIVSEEESVYYEENKDMPVCEVRNTTPTWVTEARARRVVRKWRTWVRERKNARGFAWAGRQMRVRDYLTAWGRAVSMGGSGATVRAAAQQRLAAFASRILSSRLFTVRGAALQQVGEALLKRTKVWPKGATAYWYLGVSEKSLDQVSIALNLDNGGSVVWSAPDGRKVVLAAKIMQTSGEEWSARMDLSPGAELEGALLKAVTFGAPPVVCMAGPLDGVLGSVVESWADTIGEDALAWAGLRKLLTNASTTFELSRRFGIGVSQFFSTTKGYPTAFAVRSAAQMEPSIEPADAATVAAGTLVLPSLQWPPSSGIHLVEALRPVAGSVLSTILRMINPPDDADAITLANHLASVPWMRVTEIILKQRIHDHASSNFVLYDSSLTETAVHSHWWMNSNFEQSLKS